MVTCLGFVLGPLKTAAAVDTGVMPLPAGGLHLHGDFLHSLEPSLKFPLPQAAAPAPLQLPPETRAHPQVLLWLCLLSRPRVGSFSAWAPPHLPPLPSWSPLSPLGPGPRQSPLCMQPLAHPTPAPPRLRVRARRSWSPSACHAPALPGLPGSGHLPAVPGAAPRAPGQACAPLLPRPCLPPLPAFRSLRRRRLLPRPPQPATPSPLRQQWDLVRLPVFCCDPSPAGAAIAQRLAVKTRTCGEAKALPCRARPPCPAAPQPAGGAGIVQCGRGAPGQLTVVWTGLLRLSCARP